MSLIYVEKLIKATNGRLRPKPANWRSVLFSSMIMSSKVWDDLSMWNVDFTQTCPPDVTFSLQRVNELEMAMLSCLKYEVKVLASEYAKYYFLLRSMLIRSGFVGKDFFSTSPLDMDGAKKLECKSTKFEVHEVSVNKNRSIRRTKSLELLLDEGMNAKSTLGSPKSRAVLEQVVQM